MINPNFMSLWSSETPNKTQSYFKNQLRVWYSFQSKRSSLQETGGGRHELGGLGPEGTSLRVGQVGYSPSLSWF